MWKMAELSISIDIGSSCRAIGPLNQLKFSILSSNNVYEYDATLYCSMSILKQI